MIKLNIEIYQRWTQIYDIVILNTPEELMAIGRNGLNKKNYNITYIIDLCVDSEDILNGEDNYIKLY